MIYKIVNADTNELIGITDNPRYIYLKGTGSLVPAERKQDATGVAYKSTPYNLVGTIGVGAETTVVVFELDNGDFQIDNIDLFTTIQDAMCDTDTLNSSRLDAIEDALCELDKEEKL